MYRFPYWTGHHGVTVGPDNTLSSNFVSSANSCQSKLRGNYSKRLGGNTALLLVTAEDPLWLHKNQRAVLG